MELYTQRLYFRELSLNDSDKIHTLHLLPETDQFNTLGIPDSIEKTQKLISEWLEAQNELPRKKYVFCIENKINKFIGLIGINLGKTAYKNAEIWYKIHPKYWGCYQKPNMLYFRKIAMYEKWKIAMS